jgi:hypothetical protein
MHAASDPPATATEAEIADVWQHAWPAALACWSRYTRLRTPLWCATHAAAQQEGLSTSFAMIRLTDQRVVINLAALRASGLGAFAPQVLAHEIGHHVYAPGNLSDHVRALARMRNALAEEARHAPMLSNLYTDLLINDRLTRRAGLDMAAVFQALVAREASQDSMLWRVYMRIYELLWALPKTSLCTTPLTDDAEGDARLGARLVRHFSGDWLRGAGPFALLMYPHLLADQNSSENFAKLFDTEAAGLDGEVAGLTDLDDDEFGALHPSVHPELSENSADVPADQAQGNEPRPKTSTQARQPFDYGELLRAAGVQMSPQQMAIQYYRERAAPHLIAFPSLPAPLSQEPLPEGLRLWEPGESLEAIDWLQSLLISPQPIVGLTTVQREYGFSEGERAKPEPLDLDIYIDSSGSMPDPARQLSYPALAGAVIALSALRVGGRVKVTLWSGKQQLLSTPGFVRDEDAVLAVLTGYLGGGTQFPLPSLRDGFAARTQFDRAAHILVVSDDGASTMFDSPDERGVPGFEVCAKALAQARGGGTLVLELHASWEQNTNAVYETLRRARDAQGWDLQVVSNLQGLMRFAREFVQRNYAAKAVQNAAHGSGAPS